MVNWGKLIGKNREANDIPSPEASLEEKLKQLYNWQVENTESDPERTANVTGLLEHIANMLAKNEVDVEMVKRLAQVVGYQEKDLVLLMNQIEQNRPV
ncbi:MAG: hypothetical protein COT92_00870 [Candidatus Doudnabacteria bacterium CG10_big_fil_rev_8_21_14_0_10_42_18]|uniref:Uncharacterized protein n=1 Tax=Candidatus Doudnabacteria bacterium CG10_big_fil_rev_8_21_14_0_10_42_18 TaxID=1974552 RepID=A0A2H0VDR1_9BACT|nr:MAG: hypothetical protein COT92_00870 [Candidatus Doudnabacteria bacterium CG10_big_fil_rev_8_21_14_0_10_42_18]